VHPLFHLHQTTKVSPFAIQRIALKMFLCTTLFLLHLSASFHSCLADSEVNASHSSLRAGSSVGGINRVLTGTTYSCPNVGAEPTLLSGKYYYPHDFVT